MAKRASDWLYRTSTTRVSLAALIVFVLFSALVLPAQSAQAHRDSSGAGSPDTSFAYSPARLYEMAEAYGQAGRQAYVRARFTFDLVFPLVYTFFLASAASWLLGHAFPLNSVWRLANLAPLLGCTFDYLENVSTSLVMLRYPVRTPLVDLLAPAFTLAKWVFVGGSFALLALGACVMAYRRLQKRLP